MKAVYRACDVVNEGCKAPPGLIFSFTKATCYACGLPVCVGTNCSKRIAWHRGRHRVCWKCREDAR